MSTAMEKMLSGMIGLSPEEMQSYVKNAMDLLHNINDRFDRIEKALGIEVVYTDNGNEYKVTNVLDEIEQNFNAIEKRIMDNGKENGTAKRARKPAGK